MWEANAFGEGTSSAFIDLTEDLPEDLGAYSIGTQDASARGDRPIADFFHIRFADDAGAVRLQYFVE